MLDSNILEAMIGDLQACSTGELQTLASAIRQFLVATVSTTGGHIGANLGTVELTLALERVFGSEDDQVIWDTGHQGYTHKILTCLLYTSPSPRDGLLSRMPSSA